MKLRLYIGLFLLMVSSQVFADGGSESSFSANNSGGPTVGGVLGPGGDIQNAGLGIQTDEFTGAAVRSIPLAVPPGRGGLSPQLILDYNSMRRNPMSWVGYGWDLSLGEIIRAPEVGSNNVNYYDGTSFDVRLLGQTERLERVAQDISPAAYGVVAPPGMITDLYEARVDSSWNIYLHFYKAGSSDGGWVVIDKNGTQYYFGTDQSSQEYSLSQDANQKWVASWFLDKVKDSNGNVIEVSYGPDKKPDSIEYGDIKIVFYKSGVDAVRYFPSFREGFFNFMKVSRLDKIVVQYLASGKRLLAYNFEYHDSPTNHAPLLTHLKRLGSDDSVALPVITMGYVGYNQEPFTQFALTPSTIPTGASSAVKDDPVNPGYLSAKSAIMDMDGNALPEIIMGFKDGTFAIRSASGDSGKPVIISDPVSDKCIDKLCGGLVSGTFKSQGFSEWVFIQDINGDSIPDRVLREHPGGAGKPHFLIAFGIPGKWGWDGNLVSWDDPATGYDPGINDYSTGLIDMNGDGLPDRIVGSDKQNGFNIYWNNGGGFSMQPSFWKDPLAVAAQNHPALSKVEAYDQGRLYVAIRDVTGDGLPDRVYRTKILIENGTGGFKEEFGFHVSVNKNGQGWAQPLQAPVGKCPAGQQCTYFNSSDTLGIRDPQTKVGDKGFISGDTFDLIDFNHDGYADRIEGNPSTGKLRITYYTGLAPLPMGVNDPTNNIVQFDPAGAVEINDPISDKDEEFLARGYISKSYDINGFKRQVVVTRDVNGDGYPDRVTFAPRNFKTYFNDHFLLFFPFKTNTVQFSTPGIWDQEISQPANALRYIDNGQGGVTATEYVPSTTINVVKNRFLPNVMYLVHKLYVADRQTPLDYSHEGKRYPGMRWSTYFYSGGNVYVQYKTEFTAYESRFNGFQSVIRRFNPMMGETWSWYDIETWYHQSKGSVTVVMPNDGSDPTGYTVAALSGRPYKREVRELNSVKHREIKTWGFSPSNQLPSNPDCGFSACRPLLAKSKDEFYEVFDNTPRTQSMEYQYDEYGNVAVKTFYVNASKIMDATTLHYSASAFGSKQIRNRVKESSVTEGGKILRKQAFKYDTAGNPTLVEQYANASLAQTMARKYGQYGNVTEWVGMDDVAHTHTYDANGIFPITESITLPSGQVMTTQREYHRQSGKVEKELDPHGVGKQLGYDDFGRPITESIIGSGGSKTLLREWKYDYLNLTPSYVGEVLFSTQVWEHQPGYSLGLPAQVTYIDGLGRVRQSCALAENNSLRLVRFTTEQNGRVRKQTVPQYSSSCQLLDEKLKGNIISASYDIFGRLGQWAGPTGDPGSPMGVIDMSYQHDSFKRLQRKTLFPGGEKRFDYINALGQVVEVDEGKDGSKAVYKYNAVGDLLSVTINGQVQFSQQVDWLGRKTKTTDADMGQWSYVYDGFGHLKTQTDAKGQKIWLDYDAVGRLVKKEYFTNSSIEKTEHYSYDAGAPGFDVLPGELGQVIEKNGNKETIRTSSFSYDSSYRRIAKMARDIPGLGKFDQVLTHNFKGQLTSTEYPGDKTITHTYNRIGGLMKICGSGGCSQDIYYMLDPDKGFDAYGALLQESFGNGVTTDNSYYPNSHRLKTRTTSRIGKTYAQRDYQYDVFSNIKSIADPLNVVGSGAMSGMTYDGQDRLTGYQTKTGPPVSFTYTANGNIQYNTNTYFGQIYEYTSSRPHAVTKIGINTFDYDANGNMVKDSSRAMSYGVSNQLTQVKMANGGVVDMDYDFTGARVLKKSVIKDVNGKTWQTVTHYLGEAMELKLAPVELGADGKPVSPPPAGEIPKGTVLLHISANGQRIATMTLGTLADVLKPVAGTVWGIPYKQLPPLVAAALLLALLIVHCPVFSPSLEGRGLRGRVVVAYSLIILLIVPTHLYAGDTGTPIYSPSSSNYMVYYHSDHLGSSHLVTEGNIKGLHAGITYLKGDVIQRFEYAAYGKENFILNPNLSWDPAFTGQQYDVETGLYYYRARYYNPILGRFIQPDTIVQDALDPQSWNRYAYVRNNPLKYVDPSGHVSFDFDFDPNEVDHTVAEDAASLDYSDAPSYGSTSDIPDGTYGEVFVDGVPAFADFAGGGGSGSESGGAGGSVEGGGGYSDRDYGGTSVREEGGLVGASVRQSNEPNSIVPSGIPTAAVSGTLSTNNASPQLFTNNPPGWVSALGSPQGAIKVGLIGAAVGGYYGLTRTLYFGPDVFVPAGIGGAVVGAIIGFKTGSMSSLFANEFFTDPLGAITGGFFGRDLIRGLRSATESLNKPIHINVWKD